MGKMSREKGKRGELELSKVFKRYGYEARRGQQYSGSPDSPDVVVNEFPEMHLECKRTERLNVYDAIEQAICDSRVVLDETIPGYVPDICDGLSDRRDDKTQELSDRRNEKTQELSDRRNDKTQELSGYGADKGDRIMPIVAHRRNGKPWLFVLPEVVFFELLGYYFDFRG